MNIKHQNPFRFASIKIPTLLVLVPLMLSASAGIGTSTASGKVNTISVAAPGSLDSSFDHDGRVTTQIVKRSGYASAVAVQPDGKIIVAGTSGTSDFALVRYNTDGTLDHSFGVRGRVATDFAGIYENAAAVALQTDGKIVAAGYSRGEQKSAFALARYNTDGTLDTSFNNTGKVTTNFDLDYDSASAVAIQPDGKIVAAGSGLFTHGPSGADLDFAVARYNPDGTLDTTFDGDGKAATDLSNRDTANAVAVQQDGKMVIAGSARNPDFTDFALVRYNPDGSLDSTFNSDGKVDTDFNGADAGALGVALQPDGRMVASGYNTPFQVAAREFALARYNSDGSLDNTFGGDGRVVTPSYASAHAAAVQSDGKIVAVGDGGTILVRYNEDGTLDNAFGDSGGLVTGFNGYGYAGAVAIQSDGRIIATGTQLRDCDDYSCYSAAFALMRYNTNGSPDTSFDADGKVITDFGSRDSATAVAVQSDGKIVTAGTTEDGPNADFAMLRYNADGSLDYGFDGDGTVVTDISGNDEAHAVAVQSDGKIVVAGFATIGTAHHFAIARYNPNGSLDTSFDTDGKLTTEFGCYAEALSVVIQPDGKIIAAGFGCRSDGISVFAIARYNADGSLDTTFDGDGKTTVDWANPQVLLGHANANAAALQPDGKIVVAGQAGLSYFALARINTDGSLDSSFGLDGRITNRVGESQFVGDEVLAVAVQSDGKIIAAGYAGVQITKEVFAVARYNADGSLDASFGVVIAASGIPKARAVAVQSNGKIIVAGFGSGIGYSDFAVVRLTSGGSFDDSYGAGGAVRTDFDGFADVANAVAIQPDGRIVAAGSAYNGTNNAFAVARYFGDPRRTLFDYDADFQADLSVFRPSNMTWYVLRGSGGYTAMEFGMTGDLMAPADYDGDAKTDVAVFRPSNGTWYIFNSASQTFQTAGWGASGDLPVPADHDADGKADLVVFRESTGQWFTKFSFNNSFSTVGFGVAGDKPVVGDFDGDGKADIALFRPSDSNWYILKTGFGFFVQTWGQTGDIPVPADYDGDGATDVAVFRPSTGQWLRIRSTAGFDIVNWGANGDQPIPADYDGDGKADVAVFRQSNSTWYVVGSTSGQLIQNFGMAGDVPTQRAFIY